mmetsp:Transcript_15002/g.33024  ORF Transcript_15002/g.33024 Transcript_15002/m.33024 type:complete len:259 (-) Transcript_15002:1195-1971(-)
MLLPNPRSHRAARRHPARQQRWCERALAQGGPRHAPWYSNGLVHLIGNLHALVDATPLPCGLKWEQLLEEHMKAAPGVAHGIRDQESDVPTLARLYHRLQSLQGSGVHERHSLGREDDGADPSPGLACMDLLLVNPLLDPLEIGIKDGSLHTEGQDSIHFLSVLMMFSGHPSALSAIAISGISRWRSGQSCNRWVDHVVEDKNEREDHGNQDACERTQNHGAQATQPPDPEVCSLAAVPVAALIPGEVPENGDLVELC